MFKVDCVISAFNVGRYLAAAVQSVMQQSVGFSNIRLILVDDGSTDDTEALCAAISKLYGQQGNIVYIRQPHQGAAVALNTGLDWAAAHAESEFTCFLDGDDLYKPTFMQEMGSFFESNEVDAAFCAERNFDRSTDLMPRYALLKKNGSCVYDLDSDLFFARAIYAGMFRTECLNGRRFDPGKRYTYGIAFVSELLLDLNKAGFVSKTEYMKRRLVTRDSLSERAQDDPMFIEELVGSCKSIYDAGFASGSSEPRSVPRVLQNSVIYELVFQRRVDVRVAASESSIASADVILKAILHHTTDGVLEQDYIPYWLRQHLLIIRNGSPSLNESDILPRFYYGSYCSTELIGGSVSAMQISEKNGRIGVRGFFVKPAYGDIELIAQVAGIVYKPRVQDSQTNDRKYFLGTEYMRGKDFDFDIPLSGDNYVQFFFRLRSGKRYAANFRYEASSRFADGNLFFVGDQYVISRGRASNLLKARSISEDAIYDFVAGQNNIGDAYLYQSFISNFFEFRKRRIWLFMDRRTNTDDNAEALFRFAVTKNDGIEKFFVVPDASYMPQFEGVGWTVVWNSFEFRLLLLFAEKFISSHTFQVGTTIWDDEQQNAVLRKFTNRFSNVDFVFLQHGITKENVSSWMNAYRHDVALLVTAAEKERDEFLNERYGFGESVVKLTGFPRYDRLTNDPERMILFMPTFFKPYTTFKFDYNDNFRDSDFFHTMNGLINNARLLEALNANGYRFCFKLHEELIVQRDDFHIPEGVEVIDKEVTFNELFAKASMMITDYTSAVFDFAFLRKPVIYYQAITNIKYPVGYFDYERDGFGDVILDEAGVVDKVIGYVENGCVMEPEYVSRVERFFKFGDQHSARRVYSEISRIGRRRSA